MVLYPDALKRAQEEIDRVVGPDRLPTYADRKDLPYVEALLKETLRWENVAPISAFFTSLSYYLHWIRPAQIWLTWQRKKTPTWATEYLKAQ